MATIHHQPVIKTQFSHGFSHGFLPSSHLSRMALKPTAGKAHQLRITVDISTKSPGCITWSRVFRLGRPGENQGEIMVKYENHGKMVGKSWENPGKNDGKWESHGKMVGKSWQDLEMLLQVDHSLAVVLPFFFCCKSRKKEAANEVKLRMYGSQGIFGAIQLPWASGTIAKLIFGR